MASVEHEDNLLNTRTGIFLAINTILIAAIGKEGFKIPFVVEVLGFIITMFWFRVALFNRNAIIKVMAIHLQGSSLIPLIFLQFGCLFLLLFFGSL